MPVERGDPAVCSGSNNMGGKGDMTKTPSSLQDLSKSLYGKAKAEPNKRFWGLYVHVCKKETLQEAYRMAKKNNGAPGIDGVTFEAIEESGAESFLQQIRDELITNTYRPMRVRKKEIPKDGGKVRTLSIPSIRDRMVQGALKLILEPIFEADFQPGSYGYRPKRTAHEAVSRVAEAIVTEKTKIIDLDLRAYFDNVQHYLVLAKVEKRVQEELAKLRVEINEEKSRMVDLRKQGSFGFLGFDFRRIRSLKGVWRPQYTPKLKKRTAVLAKLRDIFRRHASQPVGRVIEMINPILRGWVNYFAVGHSGRCFTSIKDWVEKKIRRHLMRARKRQGFGWKRWSREWIYNVLGLFNDYRVRRSASLPKVAPAR